MPMASENPTFVVIESPTLRAWVRSPRERYRGVGLGVRQWINISYLRRPNLRDESDNHPVELAVAGNAAWIVTGNARDVAEGELVFDGFRVVTPGEWLKGDN